MAQSLCWIGRPTAALRPGARLFLQRNLGGLGAVRIAAGAEAPEFEARSQLAPLVRLSDFRGRKQVALFFQRHLGCPLCQLDIVELARDFEGMQERGIEPIAFVESPSPSVERFAQRTPLPYHLVGDPERRIYSLYGLEEGGVWAMLSPAALRKTVKATLRGHMHGRFEGSERRLPGGFLVDTAGRVALAHYGRDVADSLTAARVLAALVPFV